MQENDRDVRHSLAANIETASGTLGNSDLTGTIWLIENIDGRDVDKNAADAWLAFGYSGEIRGQIGFLAWCNGISGTFNITDTRIRIDVVDTTKTDPSCPPVEQGFLAALHAVRQYQRETDLLYLHDESSRVRLRLRLSPTEPPILLKGGGVM